MEVDTIILTVYKILNLTLLAQKLKKVPDEHEAFFFYRG